MGFESALNEYLHAAGAKMGTSLSLDPNGICVLSNGNGGEYVVELPKQSEIIYFYSPLLKVPFEHTEAFFEKILEYNLCGIKFRQATIGLDPKTQNLVLSYTRPIGFLDETTFINILFNFVDEVEKAKQILNDCYADLQKKLELSLEESEILDEKLPIKDTSDLHDDPTKHFVSPQEHQVTLNKLKV